MTRQRAYYVVRGVAVTAFVTSWAVMPPGIAAGCVAMGAGLVGMLTCLGVNAGGPGERAGAQVERVRWERTRAPQGDWPPYPAERVVEGEVLDRRVTPPDGTAR